MEPIDSAPPKKRWPLHRALAILIATPILGAHAYHAWMRFWPGSPATQQLPFTNTDHPLQFYYGQLTRQFFENRSAFWGYDPAFMAGYAKSLIFPTSGTLPDLVAIVSGPYAAWAYNLIATVSVFITPILIGLAAAALTHNWLSTTLAFVAAVQWVWCAWPNVYVEWGMGPFILTSALSLVGAAFLCSWLDGAARYSWCVGTILSTVAIILHPLSLITLGLMLIPAYLIRIRSLNWRTHLATWSIPLVVAVCWAPWWLPAVVLRDTYGTSAIGFVNENIRERIDELLQARYPDEIALLVGALLSCPVLLRFDNRRGWLLIALGAFVFLVVCMGRLVHWNVSIQNSWPMISLAAVALAIDVGIGVFRCGEARTGLLFGGSLLLFALGYFGAAIEWLWRLQPGRFTQSFYALLILVVAVAIPGLATKLRERPRNHGNYQALLSLILLGVIAGILAPRGANFLIFKEIQPLPTQLPQAVHDLARAIRNLTNDSGRILFEDRGRLSFEPASGSDMDHSDPFGSDINPSALMPILAPGQYIGGPYLYTNLKTNFTQFGDEQFFGRPLKSFGLRTFERYAELYNVRWMVCWSTPMIWLAQA
jgi:hypothetical protein